MFRKIAATLLGLAACSAHAEIINISTAEAARLSAGGTTVIDVRTSGEWRESGVIAGSKLLTLIDERGQTDAAGWLAKVKTVAKTEQPVLLICRSGRRSQAAAQLLSEQGGYRQVYNVSGGMNAWTIERRPVVASGK